ncbi:aquaporin Z [Pelagerythrobacter aerophilus]|uniref:Aquaporin Z n=1 Tax=Pelagerythrobacter aerophilus TaxID=2306995 RepID=A0A418NJF4_9SPHN|nr:aquaporin Z [Pelagerythrobacter aerophilus]RIV79420.1 aquaporin Z [Pelagerythrobacter aerophilus]
MVRKLGAEFFGTFWLVFGGCGAAVLAAGFPDLGIGFAGVAFAFGLTVLTMAYAVGGISGAHFNPAVTLGLAVANRISWKEVIPYWIAQVVAAIVAGAALLAIASGQTGFEAGGFATNGFGELSPGGYSMKAALLIEVILTAGFLIVILGSTSRVAPAGFAPLAIGLALTLIHLVSIPVTNTSVNPARSTGVALFADTAAMGQLWLFWLAPLVGGALGALIWRFLLMPGETLDHIGGDAERA